MKLLVAVLTIGLLMQSDDVKLTHVKINKEISVDLPVSFIPIPENEVRQKYYTAKRPIAMYTSMDRKTDFAINILSTQWQNDDLEMMKRFYRSSLINLYDSVNFIREEIKLVNKRDFLVFEFTSRINADPDAAIRQAAAINYSYLQYTLVNGKLVLFSFTTTGSQRNRWQETAESIMNSVKIKKTL